MNTISSSESCAQADERSELKKRLDDANAWQIAYVMARAVEEEDYEKAAVIRDVVNDRRGEFDDNLVEELMKGKSEEARHAKLAFRPESE